MNQKHLLIAAGLLGAVGMMSSCDILKDDKSTKKTKNTCQVDQTNTVDKTNTKGGNVPTAADPDASKGSSGAAGESTANDNLPFNKTAELTDGLALVPNRPDSDVAPPPYPGGIPPPPPVDPANPFPVDECVNTQGPAANPLGVDPANPSPNPKQGVDPANPDQCPTPAAALAEDSAGVAAQPDSDAQPPHAKVQVGENNGGRCASDATITKNVPSQGHSESLHLDWQVASGLLVYEEAKTTCGNLGADWHLADSSELDQLLALPEFRAPVEANCTTSFWAAGAFDKGKSCVASYRGLQYPTSAVGSPLPINKQLTMQPVSGIDGVLGRYSTLCIKGTLKPTIACTEAVASYFTQRVLGIKDAKTGLTWGKINVKTFTDSAQVEAQCNFGASSGWRIPTKAELETAIKNDLFKTAVYATTASTCPTAWHKPDDAITKVTCGTLAANSTGEVSFSTDADCLGVGNAKQSQIYGLCVTGTP